jgi:formylglycine-generating enzyme required for sulfatase activity
MVGAVGWWKQDWLKEQYQWRVVMGASVLTPRQERALKAGNEFSECKKGCPTMVVMPAGQFTMGSPEGEKGRYENEGPQHEVTIAKALAAGKFDVTFAEWDRVCGSRRVPARTRQWLGAGNSAHDQYKLG